MHVEAASGIVLLACTLAALLLANSPWADAFLKFWKTPIGFHIGGLTADYYLQHWINDGLMTVFFFVIGLEVKREIVVGELRDIRRAALPIAAALGGMIAPALIYLLVQHEGPAARGWGVPMATDIAFVVGCMVLLGDRVPHGLRVMLLSLAIADDIGSILVIAIGYTESLNYAALAWGFVGLVVVGAASRIGVRGFTLYVVLGVLIWFAFHESGIHATISGVILGMMTPARAYISEGLFGDILGRANEVFRGGGWTSLPHRAEKLRQFRQVSRETVPPLEFLETALHPWVGFVIMPVFALANAGVPFSADDLTSPVAVAVGLALLLGKPLGVLTFSYLAIKLGVAALPTGVTWRKMVGGGFLAGIGFTMALFIAGLALKEPHLDQAKVGVLVGSALSALVGVLILLSGGPPAAASEPQEEPSAHA
jgi:NhaA family Na+:H+ antiporter